MKRIMLFLSILTISGIFSNVFAQGPGGKDIGFGIVVGEPTGGTLKIWTSRENAVNIDLGSSYFGKLRLDVDYLWHFDAFRSRIVSLYAGPGGVIGFGAGNGFWYKNEDHFYHRADNGAGFGIRGVFGLNIIPERTPLEIFLQAGLLIGLTPATGSAFDAGLGLRFYP